MKETAKCRNLVQEKGKLGNMPDFTYSVMTAGAYLICLLRFKLGVL